MQKKKGISLIVLVITIIVMIILAAAIIISLNNAGIIGNANQAVSDSNDATVVELANLAWGEAYADGKVNQSRLTANYFQAKVDETLEENNVDMTKYEVIAGENGVEVFKKDDWEFAYTATNTEWNDTKLTKGTTIPDTAKIVVKFYKTNEMVIPGHSPWSDVDVNEAKSNEYYMVIESINGGSGVVPALSNCGYDAPNAAERDTYTYAYQRSITGYHIDGFEEEFYIDMLIDSTIQYVTHVKVKEGITSIGNGAFHFGANIQSIVLPETLEEIGTTGGFQVFYLCEMNNLVIPESVTKMPTNFDGAKINNLYIETTQLTSIGSFNGSWSDFEGDIYVKNEATKTLFESKIDSTKAKVVLK